MIPTRRTAIATFACLLLAALSTPAPAQGTPPPKPAATPATHVEAETIGGSGEGKIGGLTALCVTGDDKVLAADGKAEQVRVFDFKGKLLDKWALPMAPTALCASGDGSFYVGGVGKVAHLGSSGKLVKAVDVPGQLTGGPTGGISGPPAGRMLAGILPSGAARGMAVMGGEVFVSFGAGSGARGRDTIVRFDSDLGSPKQIAQNFIAYGQRLDLAAGGDVLYLADNMRFRVMKMDRDGKVLGAWGMQNRGDVAAFGGANNPMGICLGPGGALYTAEAGLGRIKTYSVDGKFLALIGEVATPRFEQSGPLAASYSAMAVGVSSDGTRVFVQDTKANCVRVLLDKTKGAEEKR
jgi:sugar lactone lactonase YvrE